MKDYIRNRIEEITSPTAYALGMESKESIYWRLTELIVLAESYLGDREFAKEIVQVRDNNNL